MDDDVYANLIRRINSPRVVIDNRSCEQATIIQVDTVKKHGTLLELVQVLTDLNLVIVKAYITSDGVWFMDVFYVTTSDGNKVKDEGILNCIQKALETDAYMVSSIDKTRRMSPSNEHTLIEMSGTDRPGLLSEVSAVLTDLRCNVVNAEIWTHNARAAAVMHVTEQSTGCAIEDPKRLALIKELLCNVLKGNDSFGTPRICISSPVVAHKGRRLHQMLFAARDFERIETEIVNKNDQVPLVVVSDCADRDYTVITVRCKDRPKLLFDTVCSITDMQYVVFHGTVIGGRKEAYQEYYIRHVDGFPISSEPERQRVTECLEAAIKRREPEGLELELCADDRAGLLSDITRILRENGLNIKRAEISTEDGKAKDTIFVTDVSENIVDPKTVDSIQEQLGQVVSDVRGKNAPAKFGEETPKSFLLGSFFKGRNFQNFGILKSYS